MPVVGLDVDGLSDLRVNLQRVLAATFIPFERVSGPCSIIIEPQEVVGVPASDVVG